MFFLRGYQVSPNIIVSKPLHIHYMGSWDRVRVNQLALKSFLKIFERILLKGIPYQSVLPEVVYFIKLKEKFKISQKTQTEEDIEKLENRKVAKAS